ncbi:hypothetical protein [Streptomyces sp. NBRC 109706]|uniref:hypothetical protein n=1 Tax=Streptomyces sp. NBRC 109706 TaxID=1550035 RepID=UPI00078543EF|nr:hypothetical protein [Streptomyces sp. NBRC 109706]
MADGEGEDKGKINDDLDVIWWVLGVIAGIVLLARYIQSAEIAPDDELSVAQGVLLLVLLFGPAIFFGLIADQFRKEVQRGRMSWEVYWTLLSGVAASTFAFLGITGIDDVLEAWEFFSDMIEESEKEQG